MPTEVELYLFLNKRNFLRHRRVLNKYTYMSHIIFISEILMLNAIYHYYEVSGEVSPL